MNHKEDHKTAKKLFKKICRKSGVILRDHEMIKAGDHLLIGLSGGKDSMILAEVMAERRRALPFDFRISAAHIDISNIGYQCDRQELEGFCRELDINFIYKKTDLSIEEDSKKTVCFTCSWLRRKTLFNLARELKCNKLALGHHRYDALETLLLNMIYHGSISSMPYTLSMFDGEMEIIRPLLDMDEKLLAEYADLRKFTFEKKDCPFEPGNNRETVRNLINDIEKIHGKGAYNMFHSMSKIFEEYLPKGKARTS